MMDPIPKIGGEKHKEKERKKNATGLVLLPPGFGDAPECWGQCFLTPWCL